MYVCLSIEMVFFFFFAVTAVESGRRALQYLGLDGDKNAVGFDVSIIYFYHLFEHSLRENQCLFTVFCNHFYFGLIFRI